MVRQKRWGNVIVIHAGIGQRVLSMLLVYGHQQIFKLSGVNLICGLTLKLTIALESGVVDAVGIL